jgi:SET family sugar efflux transporter-like MFS transporter
MADRSDFDAFVAGRSGACVLTGSAGHLAIAFSTAVWVPFAVSTAILGLAGAAMSQLFAALHDELAVRPDAHRDDIVNVVRMALTAGWVVGPTLGAWLAAATGLRVLLASSPSSNC